MARKKAKTTRRPKGRATPREDENARHLAEIHQAQAEVDARERVVAARRDDLKAAQADLDAARERRDVAVRGEDLPLFDPALQSVGRLAGVPAAAVGPLFDHGIQTVGDLERFVAGGSAETAVDRLLGRCEGALDETAAEVVLSAFARFQSAGTLDGKAADDEEDEP